MANRLRKRPEGSNRGEFGEDGQRGPMNLLTAERQFDAPKEVKTGAALMKVTFSFGYQ